MEISLNCPLDVVMTIKGFLSRTPQTAAAIA
jgi:hypothetical protein